MKTENVRHDLAALFSQNPIPLPFFENIFQDREDYKLFLRVIFVQLFSYLWTLSEKMHIIVETSDDQERLNKRQELEQDIRLLFVLKKITLTKSHERMLLVLRGRE